MEAGNQLSGIVQGLQPLQKVDMLMLTKEDFNPVISLLKRIDDEFIPNQDVRRALNISPTDWAEYLRAHKETLRLSGSTSTRHFYGPLEQGEGLGLTINGAVSMLDHYRYQVSIHRLDLENHIKVLAGGAKAGESSTGGEVAKLKARIAELEAELAASHMRISEPSEELKPDGPALEASNAVAKLEMPEPAKAAEATVQECDGDPFAGLPPIEYLTRISNHGTDSRQMENTRKENPVVAQYFEVGSRAGWDDVTIAKRLMTLKVPRSILACFTYKDSKNAEAADKRLERFLKK